MSNSVKHFALVVFLALLAPLPAAHSAVLTFDPMVSTNFDSMTAAQAISTLTPPWTGTNPSSIVATGPSGSGNSSSKAITATGGTKLTAVSPQQSLPTAFTDATTGDMLYFSASLLKNGGEGSVLFNSSNAATGTAGITLGGFGMAANIPANGGGQFTYYTSSGLRTSTAAPTRDTWYEMALVVRLDTTNYANSLGYLYYRAAGATEFTLLPEFEGGMKMSWWTSSLNATDFAYYRIDNARNGLQIDNLSVGMVVPEPSVSMLSGAALSTLGFFATRRKK